ncbi:hypothetical protein BC829DRAFT_395746 [Chytridium lagenaria]|nr:hypothetical protein BC829DRAFT_395746 [Chytridium lagenaria]
MASPAAPNALLHYLSNELTSLSNEAKKKNPEVKEAADRLLLLLKNLKDKSSTDAVANELAKLDETARPFILGLESKNTKLVSMSVSTIQRLIMNHAIPETLINQILRSFSDLVSGPVELQVKLLQSLLPLLTIYSTLSGKVIAETLHLCFRLQDSKSPIIYNTAHATLRQLILYIFEKATSPPVRLGSEPNLRGESKSHSLYKRMHWHHSENLGLELIECVVCGHSGIFKDISELLGLLKERVCPLVIKSFSEKNDFSVALRLVRLVAGIIKHFSAVLIMECEIFLAMFSRLLEPDCAPIWHRVLVLEAFKNLLSSDDLFRSVFVNYDQKEHSSKIYQEILNGFARIVLTEKIQMLFPPLQAAAESPGQGSGSLPEAWNVSASGSTIKVQCLEQLDKLEPPGLPESYTLFLAVHCILLLADSQSSFILTNLQKKVTNAGKAVDTEADALNSSAIVTGSEMVKISWAPFLACKVVLCKASIDDDLFYAALNTYQHYSSAVGLLGLSSYRDTLISSLCRISLPLTVPGSVDVSFAIKEISQFSSGTAQAFFNRLSSIQNNILDERGVMCLRTVLGIVSSLYDVLDDKAWFYILETLQYADNLPSSGGLLKDDTAKELSKVRSPTSNMGSIDNHYLSLLSLIRKLFDATKDLKMSCFESFVRALCKLAKESAIASVNPTSTRQDAKYTEEKAFSLLHLTEIIVANIDRVLEPPYDLWKYTMNQLVDIAHGNLSSPAYRVCACAAFGDILVAALQYVDIKNQAGDIENILLYPLQRLMGIGQSLLSPVSTEKLSVEDDKPLRNPWLVEVQKAGLETLNKLLQTNGQKLVEGWTVVFEILRSVFGISKTKRMDNSNSLSVGTLNDINSSDSQPSISKIITLVRVSFPSLQLICNDFLTSLDPILIHDCIETLSCFGSHSEDVNISLTATLEKEAKGEVEPSSDPTEPRSGKSNDTSLKIPAGNSLSHTWTTVNMDVLWMHLLAHLSQLCSDSPNQSLFRTISMNGRKLTLDAWDECIWNVLFPLLERVKVSSERVELIIRLHNTGDAPVVKDRSNSVSFHHSRNTSGKQWDETKVLTLNGVTNSFISFFPVLIDLGEGFDRAWNLFLDYIKAWCLSGSTEVSMASLKCFKMLVRYPKDTPAAEADPKITSFIEKRQKSLWRVAWEVWEGIGEGIAFPADDIEDSSSGVTSSKEKLVSPRSSEPHLCRLLLYHTVFANDISTTRYRADFVNDVDNCSPLQQAVLDYVSGAKVSFSGIRGEPEATLQVIASFIRYPFVARAKSESHQSLMSPRAESSSQSFTYMAFAKRSVQVLITLFMEHSKLPTLYASGTFESILNSLAVPMKAKYSCPSPGTKDTTPLWRSAANTSVSVVQIGLQNIKEHLKEIPPEALSKVYKSVVEMFEGFLLTSSIPSQNISPEELAVDEDFDISVLETLKSDVFSHFGLAHVPEDALKDMIGVILRGTKLYAKIIPAPTSSHDEDADHAHARQTPEGSRSNSITDKGSLKPLAQNSISQLRSSSRPGSARASTSALDGGPQLSESTRKLDSATTIVDIQATPRHNFAIQCIYLLFQLCSAWEATEDPEGARFRVARIAAPALVEKVSSVLKSYIADKPTYTRLPIPRLRNEEVIVFLTKSKDTPFHPSIWSEDKSNSSSLRQLVLKGNWCHLYLLYHELNDVICVMARTGRLHNSHASAAIFTDDDDKIVTLVRLCHGRIATDLGLGV